MNCEMWTPSAGHAGILLLMKGKLTNGKVKSLRLDTHIRMVPGVQLFNLYLVITIKYIYKYTMYCHNGSWQTIQLSGTNIIASLMFKQFILTLDEPSQKYRNTLDS
jgi:hypothetical protein